MGPAGAGGEAEAVNFEDLCTDPLGGHRAGAGVRVPCRPSFCLLTALLSPVCGGFCFLGQSRPKGLDS
jgi:hypothetical protein